MVSINWIPRFNLDRLGYIDPVINVKLDGHGRVKYRDDPKLCRMLESRNCSILIKESCDTSCQLPLTHVDPWELGTTWPGRNLGIGLVPLAQMVSLAGDQPES